MLTDDRVAEFVSYSDGIDRVTLADDLRLPMPTVISTVKRLLAAGVLVETGDTLARGTSGRRPRILRRSGAAAAFGLIGWRDGALAVDCHDFAGERLSSHTLAAPDPYAGAAGLDAAVEHLRSTATRLDRQLLAVVVSVPAPFLHGRGAPQVPHRTEEMPTFSIAVEHDLERELTQAHGIPVVMDNDANLAALGELYAGVGVGAPNVVYLKINELGFGSAIVVNGSLARGAHGFAGEIAHLQLDPDGPLCACGGRGCLKSHIRSLISESAQAAYDEPATLGLLARLAAAGDPGAARMVTDIGRTIGRPLAHLCTFLDPELVILDNSIGPAVEHIQTGLREAFAVQAPPVIAQNVDVTVGALGAQAEIRGAVETLRERARRG